MDLKQQALRRLIASYPEDLLASFVEQANERLSKNRRLVPIVFKFPYFSDYDLFRLSPDITLNILQLINFVIDFELSDYISTVEWIKNDLIKLFDIDESEDLDINEIWTQIRDTLDQRDLYTVYSCLTYYRGVFGYNIGIFGSIESKYQKDIIESLNTYPQYQDYFVLVEANVNDYIFIYYDSDDQYTSYQIYKDLSRIYDFGQNEIRISIQRVEY